MPDSVVEHLVLVHLELSQMRRLVGLKPVTPRPFVPPALTGRARFQPVDPDTVRRTAQELRERMGWKQVALPLEPTDPMDLGIR